MENKYESVTRVDGVKYPLAPTGQDRSQIGFQLTTSMRFVVDLLRWIKGKLGEHSFNV